MARALAAAGARVVITGRDEARLHAAAERLGREGGETWPLVMDVRDELSVRGGIESVAARWHGLDAFMNHETMRRRGFIPYGPSRAGAESLSLIMAEDLRDHDITVNMLLPGGATLTGMIPDGVPAEMRNRFLPPDIMAAPILYLCSAASDGITGQRLVATEFDTWLSERTNGRSLEKPFSPRPEA